jgi:SAM-dependent methyltransferase
MSRMMEDEPRPYALDDGEEPERLERQAKLADLPRHLEFIPVQATSRVLDAGCGSGSMTRILARVAARGHVTGVDLRGQYLEYARRVAAWEGLDNATFQEGDILRLPFPNASFDIVWSKYVFQWVNHPERAVQEFKRVTRPGGTVVCCNADGLLVCNYPVDERLQSDLDAGLGRLFDPNVGRKMYKMFHDAGLVNLRVHIEPDRLFSIMGSIDAERRANIMQAYEAFVPYLSETFGSTQLAREAIERHLRYLDRADTISPCFLYFVQGEVA